MNHKADKKWGGEKNYISTPPIISPFSANFVLIFLEPPLPSHTLPLNFLLLLLIVFFSFYSQFTYPFHHLTVWIRCNWKSDKIFNSRLWCIQNWLRTENISKFWGFFSPSYYLWGIYMKVLSYLWDIKLTCQSLHPWNWAKDKYYTQVFL